MRWGALVLASAFVAAAAAGPASARPASRADLPDPNDVAVAALRQVCDRQWIAGVCEATGYPEPQYLSTDDPSPGAPLALHVGIMHEHSGYSDGYPSSKPADYFTAAREGHNIADGGGDTGVIVEFLISSEHSENEKLPITTAATCIDLNGIPAGIAQLSIDGIVPPLACSHIEDADHYRKWNETLAQSIDGSDDDFTAMRGFEWTNDYYNHMGVYFSRNVVNAKIDGSYVSMDAMWNWLREPAEQGGGSDALVVFNHPGGNPALTPFDGDLAINQLLADTLGGGNWNDVAYVPDVDERVAGIEVNRGDDLSWYLKALSRGWHVGPIANEDEHEREWSSTTKGKTLMLTRGRSPRDYYYALQHQRTIALSEAVINGAPGTPAIHPSATFYADGADLQDPAAALLGSTVDGGQGHQLHVELSGLAPGAPVVLLSNTLASPESIGAVGADGALSAARTVTTPPTGDDWWFVVACPVGTTDCGTGEAYDVVTAPIWFRAPTADAAGAAGGAAGAHGGASLPVTGGDPGALWLAAGLLLAFVGVRRVASMRGR